jgi:hypothetical protein
MDEPGNRHTGVVIANVVIVSGFEGGQAPPLGSGS